MILSLSSCFCVSKAELSFSLPLWTLHSLYWTKWWGMSHWQFQSAWPSHRLPCSSKAGNQSTCSKGACRQWSAPRCTWSSFLSFHYSLAGQLSEARASKVHPRSQSLSWVPVLGSLGSIWACILKRCRSSSFCPDEPPVLHASLFVLSWATHGGALTSEIGSECKCWSGLWERVHCHICRQGRSPVCLVLIAETWPTRRHTQSKRGGNCGLCAAGKGAVVPPACLYDCWSDFLWSCPLVGGSPDLIFWSRWPTPDDSSHRFYLDFLSFELLSSHPQSPGSSCGS